MKIVCDSLKKVGNSFSLPEQDLESMLREYIALVISISAAFFLLPLDEEVCW